MSIDYHVHVGPALVCKYHFNEKVNISTVEEPHCSKCNKKTDKTKFCSTCGSPITLIERKKQSRKRIKSVPGIYDLMSDGGFREDTFDECWGGLNREEFIPGHDLFAPASDEFDKLLGRKIQIKPKDFDLHFRGGINAANEITKCELFFEKELEWLRKHYDSVTVEWLIFTTGR